MKPNGATIKKAMVVSGGMIKSSPHMATMSGSEKGTIWQALVRNVTFMPPDVVVA